MSYNEPLGFVVVPNGVFTPLRNASKATVGRTSCGSNDGFPTVGVAERFVGKNCPEGRFLPTSRYYSGFGTKLSPLFRFAKSSQIQNQLPIRPIAQIRCSSCWQMFTFLLQYVLKFRKLEKIK